MKNIPVFTTENGVATLILKEIPYSQIAYVIIRDTQNPEELLYECLGFCRAAGAEKIFATGHPLLNKFPFHTSIWRMSCCRANLPDTDAALLPVTEETVREWSSIFNSRMCDVANAAYMTEADAKEMIKRGDGYFIHRGEVLLGIGIAAGDTVDAVISCVPGAGYDCMLALNHVLSGDTMFLQVASTNIRALRLYEKLGFIKTKEISSWYKIF